MPFHTHSYTTQHRNRKTEIANTQANNRKKETKNGAIVKIKAITVTRICTIRF